MKWFCRSVYAATGDQLYSHGWRSWTTWEGISTLLSGWNTYSICMAKLSYSAYIFFFVPTTKKLLNILVLKWFCSEPWTRENDFFKIYWSIVDIQCVNLCYTAMWLSYTYIFLFFSIMNIVGFPDGSAVKNLPAMQEMWVQSLDGKIPWRRAQQPSSVFSPEKSHRGAWWAVDQCRKSWTRLKWLSTYAHTLNILPCAIQ